MRMVRYRDGNSARHCAAVSGRKLVHLVFVDGTPDSIIVRACTVPLSEERYMTPIDPKTERTLRRIARRKDVRVTEAAKRVLRGKL
jgi:hypothetical protein